MNQSTWIKLGGFLLFLLGVGWVVRMSGLNLTEVTPERVRTLILSFGVWAPLAYLLAYGQPIVPLPASVMALAAGLAFGPLWGTLGALGGATCRACGQFLIARLLGRDAVASLLRGKAASIDQKIGEHGFKAVLLVRLIPNLPFDVQNYALGFSRVRFAPYALATFLGILPGSFAFVYLGYSLTDPQQLRKLVVAVLIIAGLIVTQRQFTRRQRGGSPPCRVK